MLNDFIVRYQILKIVFSFCFMAAASMFWLVSAPPAYSQKPTKKDIAVFSPKKAKLKAMQARGFIKTGLRPVYPADFDCPKGVSGFASQTRFDGSRRSFKYFRGLHGGYDIPADEGTPIVAMADGTVVHKSRGKGIGGIGIILQHAPDDTGLGAWIYTEYKHLMKLPSLELGQRVKKGQQVGLNGKTGTTGGYYGLSGFAHLHLTTWYSERADYTVGKLFVPVGGQWMDPLALFRSDTLLDSHVLRRLDKNAKRVLITYISSDGRLHPENSRIVWPFICNPKS